MAGLTPENKAKLIASAINKHALELPRAFSVITPKIIRIRPQPRNFS
ncbi:MAG: hypothetical protein AB1743_09935 [Actinomycetota bacterium]